jgi:adenylate kinase
LSLGDTKFALFLRAVEKVATLGSIMEYTTKFQSVVFMGKIASGKGTQAHRVLESFGGTLYSNGDKVRETALLPTPFGEKMKETYEGGYLMPEWVASYWMAHALVSEFPRTNIIFEGVAKKPNEALLFDEIHHWIHRPYVVFHLEIPDDLVRERSALRARDVLDSKPSVVEKRLEEYHTYTAKSIEFFRTKGTLIDIDGTLSPDEVTKQIFNYLIS